MNSNSQELKGRNVEELIKIYYVYVQNKLNNINKINENYQSKSPKMQFCLLVSIPDFIDLKPHAYNHISCHK